MSYSKAQFKTDSKTFNFSSEFAKSAAFLDTSVSNNKLALNQVLSTQLIIQDQINTLNDLIAFRLLLDTDLKPARATKSVKQWFNRQISSVDNNGDKREPTIDSDIDRESYMLKADNGLLILAVKDGRGDSSKNNGAKQAELEAINKRAEDQAVLDDALALAAKKEKALETKLDKANQDILTAKQELIDAQELFEMQQLEALDLVTNPIVDDNIADNNIESVSVIKSVDTPVSIDAIPTTYSIDLDNMDLLSDDAVEILFTRIAHEHNLRGLAQKRA